MHKGVPRLESGNKFDFLNSLAAGDKGSGMAPRQGRPVQKAAALRGVSAREAQRPLRSGGRRKKDKGLLPPSPHPLSRPSPSLPCPPGAGALL